MAREQQAKNDYPLRIFIRSGTGAPVSSFLVSLAQKRVQVGLAA
jgi:hypothetical protein